MKNLEYAIIQVKFLNYSTILTSVPINRLFLPIPDFADCSNNRTDYAYGRLIGTALIEGQTEGQTDRWTEVQTEGQKDKQKDRQRDKQRDKQIDGHWTEVGWGGVCGRCAAIRS